MWVIFCGEVCRIEKEKVRLSRVGLSNFMNRICIEKCNQFPMLNHLFQHCKDSTKNPFTKNFRIFLSEKMFISMTISNFAHK